MEKSKGSKFIKFSSKIDKQLTKIERVQAKATRKNKENPNGYLRDYSLAAWTSHDNSAATPSAAVMLLAATQFGASPSAAPARVLTSPTTSPIEDSKVKAVFRRNRESLKVFTRKLKVRRQPKEMVYITKLVAIGLTLSKRSLKPSLLTLQLLILLE
ncbi:hypothetical protein ACFX12_046799 [Malus domestica]